MDNVTLLARINDVALHLTKLDKKLSVERKTSGPLYDLTHALYRLRKEVIQEIVNQQGAPKWGQDLKQQSRWGYPGRLNSR